MEIKTLYFTTQKTARYSTYGEFERFNQIFLVCIAWQSKMLCEQMLYKFKDFDPQGAFCGGTRSLDAIL